MTASDVVIAASTLLNTLSDEVRALRAEIEIKVRDRRIEEVRMRGVADDLEERRSKAWLLACRRRNVIEGAARRLRASKSREAKEALLALDAELARPDDE